MHDHDAHARRPTAVPGLRAQLRQCSMHVAHRRRHAAGAAVLADTRAPCARRLWFDNLYLRAVFHNTENPDRGSHYIGLAGMPPLKWPLTGRGARYVTRVTIQGDGVGPTMGIWADENVYAESAPRPPLRAAHAVPAYAYPRHPPSVRMAWAPCATSAPGILRFQRPHGYA